MTISPTQVTPVQSVKAASQLCAAMDIEASEIIIKCFENAIPDFAEDELQRLYQNIFSALAKFRAYGSIDSNTSAYVVYRRDEIITLFLFQRSGNSVTVLNEFIKSDANELNRFANFIFSTYSSVRSISFGLVAAPSLKLAFPYHRVNRNEDIVTALPRTVREYHASLGRSTRQNINHYQHKLRRDFSATSFEVYEKDAIDNALFQDIIKLSQSRMACKGKAHGFSEREINLLLHLANQCGLVSVLKIENRIVAGAIYYQVGKKYFLFVIAHDSQYNAYGLGTVCCYLTICNCIERGGKSFHFLWGREEYKYRLLGVQQDFDAIIIYRSHLIFLLQFRSVLKAEVKAYVRQMKLWLLDPASHKSAFKENVIKAIKLLRQLRQPRSKSVPL